MTNQLGIQLREVEDELIRDMLLASAGQINCVGGVNGDNPTEFTATDIAGAAATLFNANAYTIANVVEGQNKFGTSPVRNAYFAMGNSNLSQSLQNVDGFIHSAQYPSQQNILESEWGSVQNVRFLLSAIGSTSANASFLGNTVYNTFIAGRFYARVKSLLIDLELWMTDNKGEDENHAERLNEENSLCGYAIV